MILVNGLDIWVQGVPARVEVGPRDVEQGTCVVARRDRPGKEGKTFGVPMEDAAFVSAIQVSYCSFAYKYISTSTLK